MMPRRTSPKGSMTPRRLYPLLALTVGLLIAVVLAEGVVRLWVLAGVPRSNRFIRFMTMAEGTPARGPLFRASADPSLGHELVPHSRRGAIRVNSHGFRGGEVDARPAKGVVRVAVIGDSETFGAALSEEDTLPGCLAAALDAPGTSRYEVLNLGVPGYNTLQELRVVETRLAPLNPDVVVLYYVLNDAELTPRTVLVRGGGLRSSYLAVLATYASKARWPADIGTLRGEMNIVDFYRYLHRSEYFAATRRMILEMARLLRARGTRFVMVVAPEIYGPFGFKRYPYHDIHARLRGLAADGVVVVDPLDRLAARGKPPRAYWVNEGDPHKNGEANRVIAAAVAEVITSGEAPARP
jgi:lysophospholipase L1-like esterase